MADQDDLLLLHHLRAHASGECCRMNASKEALTEEPGRAAGRVASWSIDRTLAVIQRSGRRGFGMSDSLVPTPQEKRLLDVVRSLADYDRESAAEAALWLVPKREVPSLLDRLAPLTLFYARAEDDHRAAQA